MKWSFVRDQICITAPSMVRYFAASFTASIRSTETPTFSVVIPCYNDPKFLLETARSVKEQQHKPVQVVFVNDGCFEATRNAIGDAVEMIGREVCVVIEQPNMGVAAARNAGIRCARGDWIVPLDYDDVIASNYLMRCASLIKSDSDVDFIYPHSLKINVLDKYWIPRSPTPRRILDRCLFPAFSAYRKQLWERVGGYDVSHPLGMDDWELFIKFVMNGARMRRLPFFMGTWRGHEDNETHTARRNWNCGRAMITTLSHQWRTETELLSSFSAIADMSDEVYQRVQRKAELFPDNPFPLLWKILASKGSDRSLEFFSHDAVESVLRRIASSRFAAAFSTFMD